MQVYSLCKSCLGRGNSGVSRQGDWGMVHASLYLMQILSGAGELRRQQAGGLGDGTCKSISYANPVWGGGTQASAGRGTGGWYMQVNSLCKS